MSYDNMISASAHSYQHQMATAVAQEPTTSLLLLIERAAEVEKRLHDLNARVGRLADVFCGAAPALVNGNGKAEMAGARGSVHLLKTTLRDIDNVAVAIGYAFGRIEEAHGHPEGNQNY